jgi:Co/Zn/Cd efflux system component
MVQKTTFIIKKMDCASEEQLIRLKLKPFSKISSMQFDIPNRRLDIYHTDDYKLIFDAINSLQLDTTFLQDELALESGATGTPNNERKLLLQVLAINFFFFALEMLTGFIANSMGLVADSLDMLADSIVYGLALFAIGGSAAMKKKIARASGYFQFLLAIFGIIEVCRRVLGFGEVPAFQTMIIISILALMGNATSLYLLQKNKNNEAHMQASMIFTSNDVITNMGVIIAGVLVFATNSKIPDLVVGTIVFIIVARGAYRIFQIAK